MTNKLFLRRLLSMVFTLTLLAGNLFPVRAQTTNVDEDIISFLKLGKQDTILSGPLDSLDVFFRLPADWEMLPDSLLHVNLNAAIGNTSGTNSGAVGFFEVASNASPIFLN